VTCSVARAQPIYAVFAAEFPTQSQANKGVALAARQRLAALETFFITGTNQCL
jgi:hypothetical protein